MATKKIKCKICNRKVSAVLGLLVMHTGKDGKFCPGGSKGVTEELY